ncbi:MAG: lipoyl synthase [Planctomycetia bacterium]|jgi:lipoic acid synthetase
MGTAQTEPKPERLPRWLKRKIPKGNANHFTAGLVDRLQLETVCDHAKCPNRMECYAQKTATFMILGSVCTRNCRFCSVAHGQPAPVDPDEPRRLAQAVGELGLKHVVITSVTRDDLPDGGAAHYCDVIRAVRASTAATVEVLPSDFDKNRAAVELLAHEKPAVYNYNTETVPRLYRAVRGPKLDFHWTLEIFRIIKQVDPTIKTKSGIMLGLGETDGEVFDWFAELRAAGCEMVTIGQYLRPSLDQMPVARYVTPEEFDHWRELALSIGFEQVASAPFVRSSYHAKKML